MDMNKINKVRQFMSDVVLPRFLQFDHGDYNCMMRNELIKFKLSDKTKKNIRKQILTKLDYHYEYEKTLALEQLDEIARKYLFRDEVYKIQTQNILVNVQLPDEDVNQILHTSIQNGKADIRMCSIDFLDKEIEVKICDKGKQGKLCKCARQLAKNKKISWLELIIFLAVHNIDWYRTSYIGGYNINIRSPKTRLTSCYYEEITFGISNEDTSFMAIRENLLNSYDVFSPVMGCLNHLGYFQCYHKYYRNTNKCKATFIKDKYWKEQARRYFQGFPLIKNGGCHSSHKIGITYNKTCGECHFAKKFHDGTFWSCKYEYDDVCKNIIFSKGWRESYACKYFQRRFVCDLNTSSVRRVQKP